MMRAGLLSRLVRPLLRPLRKPLRTATTTGPRTTNGTQTFLHSKEEMLVTSYLMDGRAPSADYHTWRDTRLVGEAVAAKLLKVTGIKSRLWTGVVEKGLKRLRDKHQIEGKDLMSFMCGGVAARLDDDPFYDGLLRLGKEHQIEGKHLMRFMSGSVAARLDDDAFFTGLVRLRDHKIEGGDLVKFMCGSAAIKLGSDDFHESLAILGRCMPATAIARLMCDSIARRLTPDYATHLVDIVTHINSHGLGGPGNLHTLLYCSPATQYVPQLRKDILGIDQPEELTAFLEKFPQSSGKTYAQIKHTLSELYEPTQTDSSAAD